MIRHGTGFLEMALRIDRQDGNRSTNVVGDKEVCPGWVNRNVAGNPALRGYLVEKSQACFLCIQGK